MKKKQTCTKKKKWKIIYSIVIAMNFSFKLIFNENNISHIKNLLIKKKLKLLYFYKFVYYNFLTILYSCLLSYTFISIFDKRFNL